MIKLRRIPMIKLENVKFHDDMSRGTNCFSSDIYMDGVKVGIVRNHGDGGCHIYEFTDREIEKWLNEWANSQDLTYEWDGETHEVLCEKLDHIIDLLSH
jgi:hypothetical protein